MPTYQQVTQLTYIKQILKEALRLWPTAPAFTAPLKDAIGGQYKRRKNTFIRCGAGAAPRSHVWGPNPSFDPDHFSPEAEAASAQRLEAVRHRPARLHRPPVRDAGGDARARHAAAALRVRRLPLSAEIKERLTIKPDGFRSSSVPAEPPQPHRSRSPPRRPTGQPPTPPRAPGPGGTQHPADGAVRVQPRDRRGDRHPDRPDRTEATATLEPSMTTPANCPTGSHGRGLRVLQRPPPDNAARFAGWAATPNDAGAGCLIPSSAAATSTGPPPTRRYPPDRYATRGARRPRVHPRGEGDARSDFDGQFAYWFAKGAAASALKQSGVERPRPRRRRRAAVTAIEPSGRPRSMSPLRSPAPRRPRCSSTPN